MSFGGCGGEAASVVEIARGNVTDRPWGRTFAAFGLRGITGQLTLFAEGKCFLVAFERGAVVAAMSPLASDAAVRVALQAHLVSSSQVPEISRRQALTPDRDEIEVIAELARLGRDHALRLRRRAIAQRAARTFSINQGEFVVTDQVELPVVAGCELDVRAVIYIGARANLAEQRLAAELDLLGGWFRLKPDIDDDLAQFGFTDLEQPVVERLRDGGTIEELEAFAASFVDARTVRAVVYALATYNACEIARAGAAGAAGATGAPRRRNPSTGGQTVPPPVVGAQPVPRLTPPGMAPLPATGRAATQQMPRTLTAPASPELPPGARAPSVSEPRTTTTRIATPVARSPATGSGSTRLPSSLDALDPPTLRVGSTRLPSSLDALDPPTLRVGSASALRSPDAGGSPGAATGPRPVRETAPWRGSPEPLQRPSADETTQRSRDPHDPLLRPRDEPPWREGSAEALRLPPAEALRRRDSDPLLRSQETTPSATEPLRPSRETASRDRSEAAIRLPSEDALRGRDPDGAPRPRRETGGPGGLEPLRRPRETPSQDPSDAAIRIPSDDDRRRGDSDAVLRSRRDTAARGEESPRPAREMPTPGGSEPLPRANDAEPMLRRRVPSSLPPRTRTAPRTDSPMSHDVKALIAQRLKLLVQGVDHFQLLGVAQDVSPDALRRAYFALARQLHPDRLAALGIADEGRHAQRLFAQINAGFAVLSDEERRAEYVSVLRRGGAAAVREEQARAEQMAHRILDAEEAFRRGELALKRDNPQAAVSELELAVQLNPDEADYHALLAWSRFCAAPDKAAVATTTRSALDKAIQRAPAAMTARFYLGRVERMLGRDAEALRHFREVLAEVPGHSDAAAELRVLESRMPGGGKSGHKR